MLFWIKFDIPKYYNPPIMESDYAYTSFLTVLELTDNSNSSPTLVVRISASSEKAFFMTQESS